MSRKTGRGEPRGAFYIRSAMLLIALALPVFSLTVLGSIWLWQNGAVLIWAAAAFGVTILIYGLERWLLSSAISSAEDRSPEESGGSEIDPHSDADPLWSARELEAWADVKALAESVATEQLTSRDAILELGTRTIETVARRIHPEARDPLWKFTVPEALALIERVSGQLRGFFIDSVPYGDRLTVAQALSIYRWRSAITIAERAYDVYRIIRAIVNPLTAIGGEMREQTQRQMLENVRSAAAKRIANVYVREVARAAIDLYSGRMQVTEKELETTVSAATRADRSALPTVAEPVRILFAGQTGAGKSSLVNALCGGVRSGIDVLPTPGGYTFHELVREGAPSALLIDAPGITLSDREITELADRAAASDLVVWVMAATHVDRETDRRALEYVRDRLHSIQNRRPPAIMFVLAHVDKLRPFKEWNPPYDLSDTENPKVASIREALAAVAEDLRTTADQIIPVSLDLERPYNVDAVWGRILERMPEAERSRLLRCLTEHPSERPRWRRLWTQAVNAGRVLTSGKYANK